MDLTLAAFYVERRDHPYWRDEYLEIVELQAETCGRFGIEYVVITDCDTELPAGLTDFVVPLPRSVMQASLVGQRLFLAEWQGGNLILADADGIVAKDPRPIFDGTFDIAVTTHPFPDSILNNGAIFVSAGSAAKAVPFWDNAIRRVAGDNWGDDQAALRDAFEATLEHGLYLRRDALVKFLPCDGYNQAPEEADEWIDSYIVHMRGDRKVWAREWVERWL